MLSFLFGLAMSDFGGVFANEKGEREKELELEVQQLRERLTKTRDDLFSIEAERAELSKYKIAAEKEEARQKQISELAAQMAELGVYMRALKLPAAPGMIKQEENRQEENHQDQKFSIGTNVKFDYGWVIPCKQRRGFKRWAKSFEELGKTASLVIPKELHDQYINSAIRIAFEKGEFLDGLDDLDIYKKKGYDGWDLLDCLKKQYQMLEEKELAIAEARFRGFTREKKERLHYMILRFTRVLAKVQVLLPSSEEISDRESRKVFVSALTEQEFRNIYQRCRTLAAERSRGDWILEGRGVDNFAFECWVAAAEDWAIMEEMSGPIYVDKKHRSEVAQAANFGQEKRDDYKKKRGECYTCGEIGHYSDKCPNRFRQKPKEEKALETLEKKADSGPGRGRGGRGRGGRGRGRGGKPTNPISSQPTSAPSRS